MNNTLRKGLAVLELLSRSSRSLSLTHIAKELGMGKSNVHRLMKALVELRFVLRDEVTGNFSPSIKLWELGSAVLGKLDLRRHAEGPMETLMRFTSESVHLSVIDGTDVVYVHKLDGINPVRAYTQIGGRAPAYCVATGKALLPYLGATALEAMLADLKQHTASTLSSREELLKEIRKVRLQGYAVNRAEWREGVWGIASPILDARGFPVAAVGISGPGERFRRTVIQVWANAVMNAAREISDAMSGGHRGVALLRLHIRSSEDEDSTALSCIG